MKKKEDSFSEKELDASIDVKAEVNDLVQSITTEEALTIFVKKIVNKMNNFLYFSVLTVTVLIDRENETDSVFSVKYSKIYKQLELTIHETAFILYEKKEEYRLFDLLIHEFVHIYTIPLTDLAMDRFATKKEIIEAGEELTETIAWHIRHSNGFHNKIECERNLIINK